MSLSGLLFLVPLVFAGLLTLTRIFRVQISQFRQKLPRTMIVNDGSHDLNDNEEVTPSVTPNRRRTTLRQS
jgi:hypothetical protein